MRENPCAECGGPVSLACVGCDDRSRCCNCNYREGSRRLAKYDAERECRALAAGLRGVIWGMCAKATVSYDADISDYEAMTWMLDQCRPAGCVSPWETT